MPVLLLMACSAPLDMARLGDNPHTQERRLLVTFVDRTIGRALGGNTQDSYQPHGAYQNSSWSESIARDLTQRHHLTLVAQWPVTELGFSCVVYEVPESESVEHAIVELQHDNDVFSVQTMQSFEVLGKPQSAAPAYSDPYLTLQSGFQQLGIAELHKFTTGKGIRIAIIDTGVDGQHPDLKGQIAYSENFSPEPDNHDLSDLHGTAVAGVIAARPDNGIGIAGISPDAEVLALRACWPSQSSALAAHCNTFTLALALNQAIRMNSHIINLSLTGPDDALLSLLIKKAIDKGIIVVAAVPGKGREGGFPANMPNVVAVAQDEDLQNKAVIAPGKDILTTLPHQAYDFMTGSSFAAPHVAGIIALLLQLHPGWTVQDVQHTFQQYANHLAQPLNALTLSLQARSP